MQYIFSKKDRLSLIFKPLSIFNFCHAVSEIVHVPTKVGWLRNIYRGACIYRYKVKDGQ